MRSNDVSLIVNNDLKKKCVELKYTDMGKTSSTNNIEQKENAEQITGENSKIKQGDIKNDKNESDKNNLKIGITVFLLKYLRFIIAGVILVITVPIFLVYAFTGPKIEQPEETKPITDDITIDFSYSDVYNENYKDVKIRFESLGFKNIEMSTEKRSWLDKAFGAEPGKTVSITINGSKEFKKGDSFPKDAKVHIIYSE